MPPVKRTCAGTVMLRETRQTPLGTVTIPPADARSSCSVGSPSAARAKHRRGGHAGDRQAAEHERALDELPVCRTAVSAGLVVGHFDRFLSNIRCRVQHENPRRLLKVRGDRISNRVYPAMKASLAPGRRQQRQRR